jgi:hypothetical protein
MVKHEIENIYKIIKHALPTNICRRLTFLEPRSLKRGRLNIFRGQILGFSSPNRIWNSDWCFYEIAVGFHPSAPDAVGAVGFISYPDNKKCGGGNHRASLEQYLEKLGRNDKTFSTPSPGEPCQGFSTYYKKSSFQTFPFCQAACDMAVLISATFDVFDKLP